jgi:hypothetical protein
MHYGTLQSKKSLLFWGEISYFEVLNYQSKFLNNLFMLKSCGILNFMIFELPSYFLKLLLKLVLFNTRKIAYFRSISKNNLKNIQKAKKL